MVVVVDVVVFVEVVVVVGSEREELCVRCVRKRRQPDMLSTRVEIRDDHSKQ